ncbi:MAG: crossover junction endodeoxyribonuclease RuvC [Spirochaetes bacterium]|nr:crossover junction endodeoxyribonuclease RuvC [Spirochaetota bacterium]
MKRFIGIDPGLASVGYGIIETRGGKLVHVAHGCISTDKGEALEARLLAIHTRILALLAEYKPSGGGMEALYFSRNVTSALPVAEAKGVIRLAFALSGVPLREYSPASIKTGVVGDGRAEKEQVQEMVRLILGLKEMPSPDHASDALAAAICRSHDLDLHG